jgi:hypothetical protein
MLERIAGELVQAAEAIAAEQYRMDGFARDQSQSDTFAWAYVPVIVTNANLSVCKFNPGDVDIANGLLPDGATFEDVPVVRFTKNLSTAAGGDSIHTLRAANAARDRTVFVVRGAFLREFLGQFDWIDGMPTRLRPFFGM